VHAGIIEPGHFRFQVVGEKVLRLEERLSFVHKGIEKRFEGMSAATGHRLAGRVSGDSTVAYAWAYSQALEAIAETAPSPRASWLRALALERERIANHLGDLGYLGNDGGFAFGLSQFSRLKEQVLRTNLALFGHRLAMDYVVPGGVARIFLPAAASASPTSARCWSARSACCATSTTSTTGCRTGSAFADRDSRARGKARADRPRRSGERTAHDVAATFRAAVRHARRERSHRRPQATSRPASPCASTRSRNRFASCARSSTGSRRRLVAAARAEAFRKGLGYVEGWRGPVLVALECGPDGAVRRCHPHDPSVANWPGARACGDRQHRS
jgi:hypothetical protein